MKDDRVYLQHIRDALDDIASYASAGRDAFFAERMRQDIVNISVAMLTSCAEAKRGGRAR